MTAPYNPETGEWTVFADPRPDKAGPYGKAVAHVPGTRPYSTPTQVLLWGDVKRAESYYPQAAQLLAQANYDTAATGEFFKREKVLSGDVRFKCRRDLYQDFIEIEAKPKPVPPGPMHLNFDVGIDNFLTNDTAIDKINGLIIQYPENIYGTKMTIPSITMINNMACLSPNLEGESYVSASSGELHYSPKSFRNDKTIFCVLNFNSNALDAYSVYSRIRKALWWGNGVADLDVDYLRDPAGISNIRFNDFTCSSSSSGISSIIALRYRTVSFEQNQYYGGSVKNIESIQQAYYNGSLVMEDNYTYTYGGGEFHHVISYIYQSPGGSAGYSQFMIVDGPVPDDDISRLTDELAKKWGF